MFASQEFEDRRSKAERGRERKRERESPRGKRVRMSVEEDVMDWTGETRNNREWKRTIQIFVKVDGSRAIAMEMALSA